MESKLRFYFESAALVEWAISMGCPTIGRVGSRFGASLLCDHAAGNRSGDIGALQWLRRGDHECSALTCERAALKGRIEVLQWLRRQERPCDWDEGTCAAAAEGGHLEVLRWARSQEPRCEWDERTCSAAARCGNLELLRWARRQDPPCPRDIECCLAFARRGGHANVVELLQAHCFR